MNNVQMIKSLKSKYKDFKATLDFFENMLVLQVA